MPEYHYLRLDASPPSPVSDQGNREGRMKRTEMRFYCEFLSIVYPLMAEANAVE